MANKVALVTGGARGIGLGISIALAKEGFDLAICGQKDAEAVRPVMESLNELGARIIYVQADISRRADRDNLMAAIKEQYGQLNVLVNNAGVAPEVRADILEAEEASFERLIRINVQGPYFLTQAAANFMIDLKKENPEFEATIINVGSISATVASVLRGDYCISKAGVGMASQLWAARLGEFNIPVFEIRPGLIKTDMTSGVTSKYDALIEGGLLLQSRWGMPDDVGKAAAMLARGDLAYSTGQVIHVDGGLTQARL